jgi:hypothetical protein
VQPFGCTRHAALAHHGAEDHQVRQVHSSFQEIIRITIIHFM